MCQVNPEMAFYFLLSPRGLLSEGFWISRSRSCPGRDLVVERWQPGGCGLALPLAILWSSLSLSYLGSQCLCLFLAGDYYSEGREELLMNILFNNGR